MRKFSEVDGGNPDGTAKDRVGLTAGTTYLAKYWNDNFFNIFNAVEKAGYSLIDDDLEQLHKALKGLYVASFTYNTSAIPTQTVNDIVLGSDGNYYEVQADGITGDDPVGSVTGNWVLVPLDKNTVNKTGDQTIAGIKTFSSFPITPSATPTLDYQVANRKFVIDTAAGFLSDAGKSLTTDGYQQLSNGLIVQWGLYSGTSELFPIAFPTACFGIVDRGDNQNGYEGALDATITATGFSWTFVGRTGFYLAIGH